MTFGVQPVREGLQIGHGLGVEPREPAHGRRLVPGGSGEVGHPERRGHSLPLPPFTFGGGA